MRGHLGATVAMCAGGFCDVNEVPGPVRLELERPLRTPAPKAPFVTRRRDDRDRRKIRPGESRARGRTAPRRPAGRLGAVVSDSRRREPDAMARFFTRVGDGGSGSLPSDGESAARGAGVHAGCNPPGRA